MGYNHDKVLDCLKDGKKMTTREISDKTNINICRVSGCLNQLEVYDLAKKYERAIKIGGRYENLWKIKK